MCQCLQEDLDAAWNLLSREAQAGLLRREASCSLTLLVVVGWGRIALLVRKLGSRCNCRLYGADHSDPPDVVSSACSVADANAADPLCRSMALA